MQLHMKEKWNTLKRSIKGRPYLFTGVFLGYIVLNSVINQTYLTLPTILGSLKVSIPYILFALGIAFLVAANVSLAMGKFKELKSMKTEGMKTGGFAAIGAFVGLVGGACPGCFVGLFPAILGLFGVTASLSVLPLYGFEIQAVSAVVLIGSLFLLTRDNVCAIKE